MSVFSLLNQEFVDQTPVWAIVVAILLGTLGMVYSATLFTASDATSQDNRLLDQATDNNNEQSPNLAQAVAVVESQRNINRTVTLQEMPIAPTRDTGTTPSLSAAMDLTSQQFNLGASCPPLFTMTFPPGSTTPKIPDLTRKIAELASWLKAHPDTEIIIEGYSSASGDENTNLLISRQRATTVVRLLSDAGVSSQQLLTRAHGEHRLLDGVPPNSAKNRRVSMKVEGFKNCFTTANSEDMN
jgi:outer membrane protein OmpA-like peptidoglycan-associated protein